MPFNGRLRVIAAALLVATIIPSTASAQQGRLQLPTIAASAAATADWVSTYHALKFYKVRETNPMLRPWDSAPGRMVTMGGAIDAAGISAWNLTVGRKHDRIAAAGLWTMTAFRVYLAIHNARNERRAERR
jgi:hypothetical protein